MVCDKNCFSCTYADCIYDGLDYEDFKSERGLDLMGAKELVTSPKVRAAQRKYYEENREKVAAAQRKYYEENREKMNSFSKSYYHRNKEKWKKYRQNRLRKIAEGGEKKCRHLMGTLKFIASCWSGDGIKIMWRKKYSCI